MMGEARQKIQTCAWRWTACGALLWIAGCATLAPPTPPSAPPPPSPAPPPKPHPVPEIPKPPISSIGTGAVFEQSNWERLPGWRKDDPALAWDAFLASCGVLRLQQEWREVCALADQNRNPDRAAARRFFETNFTPYRLVNPGGSDEGLVTGYYEPLLHGSRKPSKRYRYPLYGVPDDLLVIDLKELYPELNGLRLRGRLEGRRVVPYFDRAEIEDGKAAVRGKEIVWVDDPIDLFFLQIQGSGRVLLDDGQTAHVGFADQNGHPYRSVGRWLVDQGELPLDKASLQGIKDWARRNPARLSELLNHNARYVFFRELPADLPGPIGALGVPLTARRSVAVDPRFVPLGAPVFLATSWPGSSRPLNRLMVAQDSGGAIRGAIRADYFWGFGDDAARQAGRMKQSLRMWVLLPTAFPVARLPGNSPVQTHEE